MGLHSARLRSLSCKGRIASTRRDPSPRAPRRCRVRALTVGSRQSAASSRHPSHLPGISTTVTRACTHAPVTGLPPSLLPPRARDESRLGWTPIASNHPDLLVRVCVSYPLPDAAHGRCGHGECDDDHKDEKVEDASSASSPSLSSSLSPSPISSSSSSSSSSSYPCPSSHLVPVDHGKGRRCPEQRHAHDHELPHVLGGGGEGGG